MMSNIHKKCQHSDETKIDLNMMLVFKNGFLCQKEKEKTINLHVLWVGMLESYSYIGLQYID